MPPRVQGNSRSARLRVLVLIGLLAAPLAYALQEPRQLEGLSTPDPQVALRPPRLEGLEDYSCADCHSEVVREWADTAHAISWVDELYQEAVAERRRPQTCYSCHAPRTLLAEALPKRPRARDEARDLGISCESCHEGPGGVMLGPRGSELPGHSPERSELLSGEAGIALCSICHATNIGPVIGVAKDFAAAELAEQGLTCIGCHMAPVERKWADGDVPARVGRSHAIQTPRDPTFLRRAFEVSWKTSGGTSRVSIRNMAGHRVPGLNGRELRFEAVLLDEGGEVVERAKLLIDAEAFLPVRSSRDIRLEKDGHTVHLTAEHLDPRADAPVVFLDERLAPTER